MVPTPCDIQTSKVIVASRFIFNYKKSLAAIDNWRLHALCKGTTETSADNKQISPKNLHGSQGMLTSILSDRAQLKGSRMPPKAGCRPSSMHHSMTRRCLSVRCSRRMPWTWSPLKQKQNPVSNIWHEANWNNCMNTMSMIEKMRCCRIPAVKKYHHTLPDFIFER